MKDLPSHLRECEKIKPDVDRFMRWGELFIHPKELSERLKENVPPHMMEIIDDFHDARD